jgi:ADP-heptose:LPS heptosyltransferase
LPGKLSSRLRQAWALRGERFDAAILLQNAFDAALVALVGGSRSASDTRATGEFPAHNRRAGAAKGEIRLTSGSTTWSFCAARG